MLNPIFNLKMIPIVSLQVLKSLQTSNDEEVVKDLLAIVKTSKFIF